MQAILFKFNRSNKRNPTKPLMFNRSTIPLVKEVKYLGATIDEKTNFNSHTDLSTRLWSVSRRSKLSTTNKLLLYKSIIRPKNTYALPFWSSMRQKSMDKLQIVQNKISKTIYGLHRGFPTRFLHMSKIGLVKDVIQKQIFSPNAASLITIWSDNSHH